MFRKQGAAEGFREKEKKRKKTWWGRKQNSADQSDKLLGNGLRGGVETQLQSWAQRGSQKGDDSGMGLNSLETETEEEMSKENHNTRQMKDAQPSVTNSSQRTKERVQ